MESKEFNSIVYTSHFHAVTRYPWVIMLKDLFFVVRFQLIQGNDQQLFNRCYFIGVNDTLGYRPWPKPMPKIIPDQHRQTCTFIAYSLLHRYHMAQIPDNVVVKPLDNLIQLPGGQPFQLFQEDSPVFSNGFYLTEHLAVIS